MKMIPPLYRRALKYLRPYMFPYVAMLVVTMLVLSATNGAIPFIVKRFINEIAHFTSATALRTISFEILGIFLLRDRKSVV